MSRVNIRYELIDDQPEHVEYAVLSPDFASDRTLEIGRIKIDKQKMTYAFVPQGPLAGVEIVPPQIYGLADHEQKMVLSDQYPNARYGGWTGHIHRWTSHLIATAAWSKR